MARSEYIQIRVSAEIKKKLQTAADAENRTLSNYLINAGIEKIKEDKKMLTEKRLTEIMEEEVEKVIEKYEGNKKEFRTSAVEAVDPLNESNLTEEEARETYREWLEDALRA